MRDTDPNNEGDPMSDLKFNFDASLPTRPPWLSADEEVRALERVEDQLLDAFRVHHASGASSETPRALSSTGDSVWQRLFGSGWTWAGATALAGAAAFALMLNPGTPTSAPLQTTGFGTDQTQSAAPTPGKDLQLQAAAGKAGHVAEAKRWDMKVGATTSLAVARVGKHRRTVKLKRGFVKVHVVPGQVKEFSVQAEGYQVLVKGTVFTVEREGRWLRVEVTRGKVALRSPKDQSELPIAKGEGLRVELQSGQISRYRLPTQQTQQSAPRQRLQWLFKRNKDHAFQYGQDLASSRRYARHVRLAELKWLVKRFEDKGEHAKAIKLNIERARLSSNDEGALLLLSALNHCIDTKQANALCRLPLKALLELKRFPRSVAPLRKSAFQKARRRGLLK